MKRFAYYLNPLFLFCSYQEKESLWGFLMEPGENGSLTTFANRFVIGSSYLSPKAQDFGTIHDETHLVRIISPFASRLSKEMRLA